MTKQDDILFSAQINAQKEKLRENDHKGPITTLSLDEAVKLMKGELWEMQEELNEPERDIYKVRRELADVLNFCGAAVVACDREISSNTDICDIEQGKRIADIL